MSVPDELPKNPTPETASNELTAQIEGAAQLEVEAATTDTSLSKEEARSFEQKRSFEDVRREYEQKQFAQLLKEAIETHDLRQRYTGYLFVLTILWLTSVLLFVALTGLKGSMPFYIFDGHRLQFFPVSLNLPSECANCWKFHFNLSDKVLIAFITSTTASVIGIFLIVAKWLFPSTHDSKGSK